MDIIISIITSGVVSGAIIFLSKKYVVQLFKKDIERFKVDLQTEHRIQVERKLRLYKEEQRVLNELWSLIVSLTDAYGALEPINKEIEVSIDDLDKFVSCNEIYIFDDLLVKIASLIETVSDKSGKEDKVNEVQGIRSEIVQLIKDRVIN